MADAVSMRPSARLGPGLVVALLALVAAAIAVAFLTIGARGRWDFVLAFRGGKLATMALVGIAVATAAVLFQTIARNRILTPSIMGFDALYGLIQTGTVFMLGARGLSLGDQRLAFAAEAGTMIGFALALYGWLLADGRRSLHLMLLVGVVLGAFFRSLASFIERMIDPTEFVMLQNRLFANFNAPRAALLLPAALAIGAVLLVVARSLPRLDVLLLGREAAIGLGVDHRRSVFLVIVLVSVLVSVSTALVGPVTFLGLLVANLAYRLVPGYRHVHVLPAAALLAVIALVGGQLVLERVFALDAVLPVVIEFLGGLVLIALLVRRAKP